MSLAHVKRATLDVTAEPQARLDESIRLPGADMPGTAIAGRFWRDGDWVFWHIHDGHRANTIDVRHDGHVNLVVEVEDSVTTFGLIDAALAG